MAFLGGNSTKATSGINGAPTRTQMAKGIPDTAEIFEQDCLKSATGVGRTDVPPHTPALAKVLAYESGPSVDWLTSKFGLDLSLVSRLGGHTHPRTHRGKERFPGFTITYALLEALEKIEKDTNGDKARIISKARVTRLHKDASGKVVGCDYEKDGRTIRADGSVIICTGGFAADFGSDSLLAQTRPDLMHLPTTNGEHCTGDGIKMSMAIGAGTVDMESVQVHPTGLVHPDEPDAKVKFLAAEALRGVGGLMLDANGKRFCDELGRRDYVSGMMWKNKGPFRLVLNSKGSEEIAWHAKHYVSRGVMKRFTNIKELANEIGCSVETLDQTFNDYKHAAKTNSCPYNKKFFTNADGFSINDTVYHSAIVTPIVHYCMGGLAIDDHARVLAGGPFGTPIRGLYGGGEVVGGIHGRNRLGGNSLLDCVVYGRVAGATASHEMFADLLDQQKKGGVGGKVNIEVDTGDNSLKISFGAQQDAAAAPVYAGGGLEAEPAAAAQPAAAVAPVAAVAPAAEVVTAAVIAPKKDGPIAADEVAKHNTDKDCWVILNGKVYDVTKFLPDHPGGARAITLYAGKDASEEFNMLHAPNVLEKYLPAEACLGDAAPAVASKL